MAQEVTLGGQRLGSGNGMTQELYNYGMNSFNQSRDFKSTMAPGILYPCFREVGTNHGTFDIDIDALVRTLPTKGPLLGSFKMQVDLFTVPFRLYQGILHNNPVDIGLNMNQVYLPQLLVQTVDGKTAPKVKGSTDDDSQIANSALLKYDGISGIGHSSQYSTQDKNIGRYLQCVPELGYYDIFKNYYSNKQEEKAYIIVPGTPVLDIADIKSLSYGPNTDPVTPPTVIDPYDAEELPIDFQDNTYDININVLVSKEDQEAEFYYDKLELVSNDGSMTWEDMKNDGYAIITYQDQGENWAIRLRCLKEQFQTIATELQLGEGDKIYIQLSGLREEYTADIKLEQFTLKNIDKMRAKLLANNELGDIVTITDGSDASNVWGANSGEDNTGLPYVALAKKTSRGITWNAFEQNGLVVKTYQSDLFNNWLDSSFVDTIAQRTKIDTTSGGFTPDTLILQEKIYKLLNRILVSGGTYYDWQEATYGEGVARMCEIPMYIGGMSTEIIFEEVIANSAAEAEGKYQALGSLGGKGTLPRTENGIYKKGGNNIHVRMDEPGYIIGICSITPRISVCQGNDWDRTEIATMDDLHKPELDGIGFQDLMAEQLCWWNTVIDGTSVLHRDAVGKQTAWINYQTAMDKVYGDFAKQDGYSFMVLTRNYEHDNVFGIKDLTTYIDPAKYNYAFAYQDLAAQNFWVQLNFKCVARRKMGAQQLPNL